MLIQTHRLISKVICSAIQEKLHIQLDMKGFKYGSIKPDINHILSSVPHYKKETQGFVYHMINDLQNRLIPKMGKELRDFSIDLGIVTHYLADYFCMAHNHPKYHNILNHVFYEYTLDRRIRKINLNQACIDAIDNISQTMNKCNFSIEAYIEKEHAQYIGHAHKISFDIKACMDVCTAVTCMILNKCQQNLSHKVA
ncbi:MAG: zinc dependent phospholipase C family protein [Firmicutes bacterium]|nr:zinc dependent phospholipase C family protein [Bacillota bacterium]